MKVGEREKLCRKRRRGELNDWNGLNELFKTFKP